jgi:hypothetical protein
MAKRKTTTAKQLAKPDTALLAAVRKGNLKGLRAALEDGEDPNATDEQGAALAQAANHPVHSEEMVLALLAAGADLAALRNSLVWARCTRTQSRRGWSEWIHASRMQSIN